MRNFVKVYSSHAGISCEPTPATQKKLDALFAQLDGVVEYMGDKSTGLKFTTELQARTFHDEAEKLGASVELCDAESI